MIVMTTLTFFVKTILTKKLWFVKPEISLSVLDNASTHPPANLLNGIDEKMPRYVLTSECNEPYSAHGPRPNLCDEKSL